MGLIKALAGAVGGGLADTWLEVVEPANMGEHTVCTPGVFVRKGERSSNTKGTRDTISNGSIIHVYDNQAMLLVDGGKMVGYTDEPGYYKVDNSSLPSIFGGGIGASIKETFARFKYGGTEPTSQKVFFINLQEIKGNRFGTRNPVNYFDTFYNAELELRANGTYSFKIIDPILFYQNVVPRNQAQLEFDSISEQFLDEFLEAFGSALNQMSADGERISFVRSKSVELGKYMSNILDEEWRQNRGMEIVRAAVGDMSYSEESRKLLNMRNQGAMLQDPTIRESYMQGSIARGLEAAGSNPNGAMNAFMGMGMAGNMAGGLAGGFSQTNAMQMQQQQQQQAAQQAAQQQAAQQAQAAAGWTCPECNQGGNTGNFCQGCGKPKPAPQAGGWTCPECGQASNNGNFCQGCGKPKPAADNGKWTCSCGQENSGNFCANCGNPKP